MHIVDMPLFPLKTVLFPHMALPLHVFEERYKLMMRRLMDGDRTFGVALIKSGEETGEPAEPFTVGTSAQIMQVQALDQGKLNVACVGVRPFQILDILDRKPYIVARVSYLEHTLGDPQAASSLAGSVRARFTRYLAVVAKLAQQAPPAVDLDVEPQVLSYLVAADLQVDNRLKQRLLEMESAEERLSQEAAMLEEETKVLRIFQAMQERDLGGRQPPRGPGA